MADLALESKVDGEAGEVACIVERGPILCNVFFPYIEPQVLTMLFGHVAVGLVQFERLAQIVLQQFELWIQGDTVACPFKAYFLIVVGNCIACENWFNANWPIVVCPFVRFSLTYSSQCKSDRSGCPSDTAGIPFGTR